MILFLIYLIIYKCLNAGWCQPNQLGDSRATRVGGFSKDSFLSRVPGRSSSLCRTSENQLRLPPRTDSLNTIIFSISLPVSCLKKSKSIRQFLCTASLPLHFLVCGRLDLADGTVQNLGYYFTSLSPDSTGLPLWGNNFGHRVGVATRQGPTVFRGCSTKTAWKERICLKDGMS